MIQPSELIVEMRAIADEIELLMQQHERDMHGSNRCEANRESVVGYLAHCLGVRSLKSIGEMIRLYDMHCPNCEHIRN